MPVQCLQLFIGLRLAQSAAILMLAAATACLSGAKCITVRATRGLLMAGMLLLLCYIACLACKH